MYSPSSTVASAAGKALETLAGINAHEAVSAVYEQRGFAGMTRPQQYYHAVEDYRNEVDNGGHNQYFYNSYSDLYETAIEGLRAIGAPGKADTLSKALRAFILKPSTDNAARRSDMERFGPLQDGILKLADKSFSASEERPGERLDVLLSLYALNRRTDFVVPLVQKRENRARPAPAIRVK